MTNNPSELDPSKLALSRQLRADFAADLLAFCAKWQDNLVLEGLTPECGVVLSVPLMDAAVGHVVAMELMTGRRGSLSGPLFTYGQQKADRAWGAREEIEKEIMEMLEKHQKR